MSKISKEACEKAIKDHKAYKDVEREAKTIITEAEEIVSAYAREHITEFTDDKLALREGIIAIRAGAAKPTVNGKPLPTAERLQLARLLPTDFVKLACDFGALYGCDDKRARQLLEAHHIKIEREDKYVVL